MNPFSGPRTWPARSLPARSLLASGLVSGLLALGAMLCPGVVATGVAQGSDIARQLDHLVASYPAALERIEGNALVWKDGTQMRINDGAGDKSHTYRLEAADIKDMFHAPYVMGAAGFPPGINVDPGRIRHEPLFTKMYGDCRKGEVQRRLVDVVWLPQKWGKTLKVTSANGVAEKLTAISAELDRLPAELDRFLFPAAGTFNCREIAGTTRISSHGHGTAIDIATRHAHYWRWDKAEPSGAPVYKNEVPMAIVSVFEKHGFIWGGKWYHYDTMHFEYRPELLPPPAR